MLVLCWCFLFLTYFFINREFTNGNSYVVKTDRLTGSTDGAFIVAVLVGQRSGPSSRAKQCFWYNAIFKVLFDSFEDRRLSSYRFRTNGWYASTVGRPFCVKVFFFFRRGYGLGAAVVAVGGELRGPVKAGCFRSDIEV